MKIVLLLGPSSAGKSTTCAELQRDGWRVSAFDEVMAPFYDNAKEECRAAYASKGVFSGLQAIMTENEVMDLCIFKKLNISKGTHVISNHQFSDHTYPGLAELLTEVGFSEADKQVFLPLLKKVGETFLEEFNKLPNPASVLLDDAFRSTNPDELVVIDHIPEPNGRAEKFIEGFQERVKAYQQAHGEDSIQSSIILALCTPQELSARVLRRNAEAEAEAEATGNLSSLNNKRVGTFPFDQLAVLLSSDIFHETQQRVGSVSTEQLRQIAYHHQDHRQLSAAATSGNPASEIVESVLASVFNYSDLSQRFNLASDREMHDLAVRDDFSTFPRINTLSGNPAELAKQIIDIVESERVSLLKSNAATFREFLEKYSAYFSKPDSDKQKTHLANAFWKLIDTIKMPVVELADDGSYQVHFLYRKTQDELAGNNLYIQSDYHGFGSTLETQRLNPVGTTDVMCVTTKMGSEFKDALIAYHFVEAPHAYANKSAAEIGVIPEGQRLLDPRSKHHNSDGGENQFCLNSENDVTPWRGTDNLTWPTFQDVRADDSLIHFRHKSDGEIVRDRIDIEKDVHSIQILKPTDDDVKKIVIINDGLAYLLCDGVNRLQEMADREKCAFIFISPGKGLGDENTDPLSGVRGIDYHYGIDQYNNFVLNQLLPELHRQNIIPHERPTNMTIVGASLSGTAALQMGLTHPDRFSQVIAHSPSSNNKWMIDSTPNVNEAAKRVQIDLEYGLFETIDYAQNPAILPYGQELAKSLGIKLHIGVHGHQYEPWMHDLVIRSLPAMLATPVAAPVSEKDIVSARAASTGVGFIAGRTNTQRAAGSAQEADNANSTIGESNDKKTGL